MKNVQQKNKEKRRFFCNKHSNKKKLIITKMLLISQLKGLKYLISVNLRLIPSWKLVKKDLDIYDFYNNKVGQ